MDSLGKQCRKEGYSLRPYPTWSAMGTRTISAKMQAAQERIPLMMSSLSLDAVTMHGANHPVTMYMVGWTSTFCAQV